MSSGKLIPLSGGRLDSKVIRLESPSDRHDKLGADTHLVCPNTDGTPSSLNVACLDSSGCVLKVYSCQSRAERLSWPWCHLSVARHCRWDFSGEKNELSVIVSEDAPAVPCEFWPILATPAKPGRSRHDSARRHLSPTTVFPMATSAATASKGMASLIVAGGLYTQSKIRDRKEAKKEKKRQEYERRYSELEAERKVDEEKFLARQKTGDSKMSDGTQDQSNQRADTGSQQHSPGSPEVDQDDGPARWVEAALKKRQTSQSLT